MWKRFLKAIYLDRRNFIKRVQKRERNRALKYAKEVTDRKVNYEKYLLSLDANKLSEEKHNVDKYRDHIKRREEKLNDTFTWIRELLEEIIAEKSKITTAMNLMAKAYQSANTSMRNFEKLQEEIEGGFKSIKRLVRETEVSNSR